MARVPDLGAFAAEHGLKIITIAELIELPPPHREAGRARQSPRRAAHASIGEFSAHRLPLEPSTASTTWRW